MEVIRDETAPQTNEALELQPLYIPARSCHMAFLRGSTETSNKGATRAALHITSDHTLHDLKHHVQPPRACVNLGCSMYDKPLSWEEVLDSTTLVQRRRLRRTGLAPP